MFKEKLEKQQNDDHLDHFSNPTSSAPLETDKIIVVKNDTQPERKDIDPETVHKQMHIAVKRFKRKNLKILLLI